MPTVETKYKKRQISFKLKTADDTVQDVFLGLDSYDGTATDPVTVLIDNTDENLIIQTGTSVSKITRIETAAVADMNKRIGTAAVPLNGDVYADLDGVLTTRIVPIKTGVHSKLNTTLEKSVETINTHSTSERTAFTTMSTNRKNLKVQNAVIAAMETYAVSLTEAIEFDNYGLYNSTIKGVTFGVDLFAPDLNPVTSTNNGASTTLTTSQVVSFDRYLRVYFVTEAGTGKKNRLVDSSNIVIRDGGLSLNQLVSSKGAKYYVGDDVRAKLNTDTVAYADVASIPTEAAVFSTTSAGTLYEFDGVSDPEYYFSLYHKLYFYKPTGVSSYYVIRNSDGSLLQGYVTSSINKTTEFYTFLELKLKKYTTTDAVTTASGKLYDLVPVLAGYKMYIVSSADIIVKNKTTNLYYVLRTKADNSNSTNISTQYYLTKLRTLYGMHLKDGYYAPDTLTKTQMQTKRVFFYSEDYESTAISVAEPAFSNAYAWVPLDAATITAATQAEIQTLIASNPAASQEYVRTMAALYNNNADMYAVVVNETRSGTVEVLKPLRHKLDGYRVITGKDTGARSASAQDIQDFLETYGTYLTGPVDDLSQPVGETGGLGPTSVTPVGFVQVAPAETAVVMATPTISTSTTQPRILLTWTEVANATNYLIQYSTSATFATYSELALNAPAYRYLFTVANASLLEGTTYYFRIKGGNVTFPIATAAFSATASAKTFTTGLLQLRSDAINVGKRGVFDGWGSLSINGTNVTTSVQTKVKNNKILFSGGRNARDVMIVWVPFVEGSANRRGQYLVETSIGSLSNSWSGYFLVYNENPINGSHINPSSPSNATATDWYVLQTNTQLSREDIYQKMLEGKIEIVNNNTSNQQGVNFTIHSPSTYIDQSSYTGNPYSGLITTTNDANAYRVIEPILRDEFGYFVGTSVTSSTTSALTSILPSSSSIDTSMDFNTFKQGLGMNARVVRVYNYYMLQLSGTNFSGSSVYTPVFSVTGTVVKLFYGFIGSIQELYDLGGRIVVNPLGANSQYTFTASSLNTSTLMAYNASTNPYGFRVLPEQPTVEIIPGTRSFTAALPALPISIISGNNLSYDSQDLLRGLVFDSKRTLKTVMIVWNQANGMYYVENERTNFFTDDMSWAYTALVYRESTSSSTYQYLATRTMLPRNLIIEYIQQGKISIRGIWHDNPDVKGRGMAANYVISKHSYTGMGVTLPVPNPAVAGAVSTPYYSNGTTFEDIYNTNYFLIPPIMS